MANGLLTEFRRIAESSKDIPQEAVNRLMLSALAELVQKVDKHTEVEEIKNTTIDAALDNMSAVTSDLTRQVTDISGKLTILTAEIASIRGNPVVAMGGFAKRHPKTSLFISIAGIFAVVLLLSSRPFLVLLLTLAGVPSEAIEQILLLLT